MHIEIPILPDEKGYIDRKCQNENCSFIFKIKAEDYNKLNYIYCPKCGYKDESPSNWMTDEQYTHAIEFAKSYAIDYVQKEINKMFSNIAKNTRNNKYCKITYKPSKRVSYTNNPIVQREKWTLDITCENCATSYSVIGTAYFCPKCGFNNILNNINDSLTTIKNMIDSQEKIYIAFNKIFDNDKATIMCQKLLEDSLRDIVSAFQMFAFEMFKIKVPFKKVKSNDFQIVEVGNNLFEKYLDISYTDFITTDEMKEMNIYFQRRHLLEHSSGIVDQKYLDKSDDYDYKIGQRIVVKIEDVTAFLNIINKLCKGLKSKVDYYV